MDVWSLDRPVSMDFAERWIEVLDDEERARAGEFRTPELRARHVAAHALVRTALSTYASMRPEGWRYAHGPGGQPTLVDAPLDLRFSLSHSGAHAAVAVTVGHAVGLDSSRSSIPRRDVLALAKRFFTDTEQALLLNCQPGQRGARFTTLWTVKEAVLKARGLGLGSGLRTVEASLDAEGRLASAVAPEGPWSVVAWEPVRDLRAAVAVQGGSRSRPPGVPRLSARAGRGGSGAVARDLSPSARRAPAHFQSEVPRQPTHHPLSEQLLRPDLLEVCDGPSTTSTLNPGERESCFTTAPACRSRASTPSSSAPKRKYTSVPRLTSVLMLRPTSVSSRIPRGSGPAAAASLGRRAPG